MADRHETHDLERLVAFVDGELGAADVAAAEAQVADCPSCALLAIDLRALAMADRALATPARPRDFRLTPADAARLGSTAPEPIRSATRLGDEMTKTPSTHATHDPLLIAASVDGGLTDAEREHAAAWLATCATCEDLRADLIAIAAAHRALPTPPRPRDLRLTERDAARLRSGGWRAILERIGSARDGFTRPLAAGLTTLGLVGLLVSSAPSFLSGSAGAAAGAAVPAAGAADQGPLKAVGSPRTPDDSSAFTGNGDIGTTAAEASGAPAPNAGSPEPSAAASASTAPVAVAQASASAAGGSPEAATEAPFAPLTSPGDVAAASDKAGSSLQRDAASSLALESVTVEDVPSGPSGWVIASLLALLAGLALFAIRWSARRLRGV